MAYFPKDVAMHFRFELSSIWATTTVNLTRSSVIAFIIGTSECLLMDFWPILLHFYPLDAMLERVIAVATCLSGSLSVTAGIVSKRKQLAS